jgi:hypothetical protein
MQINRSVDTGMRGMIERAARFRFKGCHILYHNCCYLYITEFWWELRETVTINIRT